MAEWRTQEQINADEELSRALARVLKAYSDNPEEHDKFMLNEYVIVSTRVGMTDETSDRTQYDYTFSNGSVPWHNAIGMLAWAKMTLEDTMRGENTDA